MESKKKENKKGKGNNTLSHGPSVTGSTCLGFSFDADFLHFLRETTPCVDFYGFLEEDEEMKRVYTRLNVPSNQIPKSVVKQILNNPDVRPFVLPNFHPKWSNCNLFGIGAIPKDLELTGVRHLRIDYGKYSHVFIATRQKLTFLEATECCMWFRASTGMITEPRSSSEASNCQYLPVPVTYADGTSNAKATIVDGPLLDVPDFVTRATFMIDREIPGWELHTYNLNQRSRIGAFYFKGKHPNEVMSRASGIAHYHLASGFYDDDAIAKLIADHFSEYLEKYRCNPKLALQRGYQYLQATKNRIQSEDIPF